MIVFLAGAGVLLAVSLLIIIWPLWRGTATHGSRREANIAVFEQHRDEVAHEMAAGRITQADADAHQQELGARLLADVDAMPESAQHGVRRKPWFASGAVVIGFLVVAAGLYGVVGDTRGIEPRMSPDIAALVTKMKTRLAENPDDLRTRALLAQEQMVQHEYAAAAANLGEINKRRETPDATYLIAEGRSRYLSQDGTLDDRTRSLYEQALQLAPDEPEALWFGGLVALVEGRREVAIERWQRLLRQDIPDDFRQRVEQRLAEQLGDMPALEPD